MRVAIYARVSTTRQAQTQTIEQQLTRLQAYAQEQGWSVEEQHLYRDDGYSGASLHRPGLDRLRDRVALAELDLVLITTPDRLARKYVHQVLLLEELEQHGCRVEFLDRPMSQDPHDQLLLQIRGAVAEYERTLIAERMRRGRLAKLQAGELLPWVRLPFGYRADPERPRDPRGLRVEESEAVVVQQMFDGYLEEEATLYRVAQRLTDEQIPTPTGQPRWNVASVRGILKNPVYTGTAYANRTQAVPARQRKSALRPVGPGQSQAPRPSEEWIPLSVPALVSQETFDLVQAKLAHNQQTAARNNKSHDYLLRGLVSCGVCQLSAIARTVTPGYPYYVCRGRSDALRIAQDQRCTARYAPAAPLDERVWQDLCVVLTQPEPLAQALERAHGGQWLPQELQARQTQVRQALAQVERQQQRLLDAYLAAVVELAEFERKRTELAQRAESFLTQQRQLEAHARQRLELSTMAASMEAFCAQVRAGLDTATFAQRRTLVELLIDRVIVTDGQVEIRYVIPTSPEGPHYPFCHLRKDYFHQHAAVIHRKRRVRLWQARQHPPRLLRHLPQRPRLPGHQEIRSHRGRPPGLHPGPPAALPPAYPVLPHPPRLPLRRHLPARRQTHRPLRMQPMFPPVLLQLPQQRLTGKTPIKDQHVTPPFRQVRQSGQELVQKLLL
jgi:site-specific DNA recombinase